MIQTHFHAEQEVARLRQRIVTRKQKKYTASKLDKWRHEILSLKEADASLQIIVLFLAEQRVKVHKSTVSRWLHNNA